MRISHINPYKVSQRLTTQEKRILNFIFSQQDAGASIQKVAANLRIPYYDVQHIFSRLIKAGEIFRVSKVYKSTAWFMAYPKPRLRDELERDLFGTELTPRLRKFLTEFSSGVKLGLSTDESFHLASRKTLEAPQAVEVG